MTNTPSTSLPIIQPVILAGGSGTRLWPLSRQHYAKQYIALDSKQSMLQTTVERLSDLKCLAPLIVCNEESRFLAAEQMRQIGLSDALILLEPAGRNTAPAIALAAFEAVSGGSDPILLVLPADHNIRDTKGFLQAVEVATSLTEAGHLVTFGILPTRPETGYGYIKTGEPVGGGFKVEAFIEKPGCKVAETYLDTQGSYWNAGIFMFRASLYLEELQNHRPDILEACGAAFAGNKRDLDFLRFDTDAFLACPSESIDYAVMENTDRAVVLPLDAGWSDIGSWAALWEVLPKDDAGNCEIGDVITIDGSNNYIHSSHRLVATVGLENIVVVETKDAIFVAPKDKVQNVSKLVEHLKETGRSEYQYHREVYRPWGKYDCVDAGGRYQVKLITVNPGATLSLQKHLHRAEHWVVVRGTAKVTKGEEVTLLSENQSTYIPLGEIHALENPGKIPLELIEVQSGSYLGEDDIIRFGDRYGRT